MKNSFAINLIARGLTCLLMLRLAASSVNSCAASGPDLDRRVVESPYFRQLVAPERWESTTPLPQDIEQQHQGWCGTGFDLNQFRARNLANSRHFAEAIKEWSIVIEKLQSADAVFDTDEAFALIERARLYEHIGLNSEALADVQSASRLTELNDEIRLRLALLSIDLGENLLAETLLAKAGDLSNSYQKPIYKYVLAVAQKKNGKVSSAVNSFMEAAKLFAIEGSLGSSDCAAACLDAAAGLNKDSRQTKITVTELMPPSSHFDEMLHLVEALATRKDIFENGVLEEILSAESKETVSRKQTLSKVQTNPDSSQIPKPTIEKLPNNGMRISMYLRPEICVLTSDDLKHVLRKPLPQYDERHTEYRGSKVYKVPSGLLVIASREGGFNAIWLAQVYSTNTVYPQPRQPIPLFTADYLKDPSFKPFLARADANNLKFCAGLVEDTLKKDPTNVQALAYKSEIAAKQHDLDQALAAINQAIKLQAAQPKNASRRSEDTGNPLLIDKGNYLLEQKKFAEALTIFEQAFPNVPEADQLYQRAKAEIGVGKYDSARKDLSDAADRYFFWGRIARRDEARKLLAEIGSKDLLKDPTASSTEVATQSEILEGERNKAKELREQISAESRLKNAESLRRQQKSINERCKDVLISMSNGSINPLKLTDALVNFAQTATQMKQLATARALLDRAIQAYCTSGQISEYDGCTVPLIEQLEIFPDEQICERLRAVAACSEKFCDDKNFRRNRDDAFNHLIMQYPKEQQMVLLRTMIDIRERQSKSSKFSSKIWQDRLNYVEKELAGYPADVIRPKSLSPREQHLRNRFNPEISEQFDAALSAIAAMERMMHQLDGDSQTTTPLTCDWNNFVLDLNCEPALKQMLRFAGDLAIANVYLQKAAPKLAADSIHEAVNNMVETDLDCLIDSLTKLRCAAELNRDFVLAELAYEQALAKVSATQPISSIALLELKLSLAELFMNHQRALSGQENSREYREKGKKLFDECQSIPFDDKTMPESYSKSKIAVRRMIAMKYPALQKLDLPHGEIIYREIGANNEVEHYIEIGKRGAIGRGPNTITLGHTIEILIDGRTLTEKSFEQMDAGNLTEAERILIAALRAKPTQEDFALLGECWFLKNEKSNALQACLMALDMDRRSPLALALKQIIGCGDKTDEKDTLILRATLTKNSKENVVTQALCMVALHKSAQARQFLLQYLRREPKSYLAKQLILLGPMKSNTRSGKTLEFPVRAPTDY